MIMHECMNVFACMMKRMNSVSMIQTPGVDFFGAQIYRTNFEQVCTRKLKRLHELGCATLMQNTNCRGKQSHTYHTDP